MPVFEFEAVETRGFSGVVFAASGIEAMRLIENQAEDYPTDWSSVEIASVVEVPRGQP